MRVCMCWYVEAAAENNFMDKQIHLLAYLTKCFPFSIIFKSATAISAPAAAGTSGLPYPHYYHHLRRCLPPHIVPADILYIFMFIKSKFSHSLSLILLVLLPLKDAVQVQAQARPQPPFFFINLSHISATQQRKRKRTYFFLSRREGGRHSCWKTGQK